MLLTEMIEAGRGKESAVSAAQKHGHPRFMESHMMMGRSMFRRMARSVAIWPCFCLVSALLADGCGASSVHTSSIAGVPARIPGPVPSQVYRVPSGSMEPTLPLGTRVTVKKGPLVIGAIVVAHPPQGFEVEECGPKPHILRVGGAACDTPVAEKSKIETIKRIVAGPGDAIYIRAGHVYRKDGDSSKFIQESDPYTRACGIRPVCNFPVPIKIPAGEWFLMGDNRGESDDSRFWGPVPMAWIVGMAADYRLPKF
jgi:signal peptidase I